MKCKMSTDGEKWVEGLVQTRENRVYFAAFEGGKESTVVYDATVVFEESRIKVTGYQMTSQPDRGDWKGMTARYAPIEMFVVPSAE